jgi:GxxExxY protein
VGASEAFDGLHARLTTEVIRVFYAVARELESGFLEKVYRRSLSLALRQEGFSVEEEVAVPVYFRQTEVGIFYADIIVNGLIILELTATEVITKQHKAQLTHYLRATTLEVGYVLAFDETPTFQRVILTNDRKRSLSQP